MKKPNAITASEIIEVLRERHSQDVFVPECKDGATHSRIEHFKLDAWVMNKSWANPCVTGYEVKVSRSDFVRDAKWRAYLPMCNELYFVCPRGLIAETEMSDGVGLVWVSGSRAFTKKRAQYREVIIPEEVFRYVLMCRATIDGRNSNGGYSYNREQWQAWLKKREEDRELGWNVARGIREHVERVDRENSKLKSINNAYDSVKSFLEARGLSVDRHTEWTIEQKLQQLKESVPKELLAAISDLVRRLQNAEHTLRNLTQQPDV